MEKLSEQNTTSVVAEVPVKKEKEAPAIKKNIAWANTIKNHHLAVRSAVTTATSGASAPTASAATSSSSLDESYTRWRAQRDASGEQLTAYANAMHDLATEFWSRGGGVGVMNIHNGNSAAAVVGEKRPREEDDSNFSTTTGRYDDRVQIVVDAVREFYFGDIAVDAAASNVASASPAEGSSSAAESASSTNVLKFSKYPTIITQKLRQLRQSYFQQHGQTLPAAEERARATEILAEGKECMAEIVGPAIAAVEGYGASGGDGGAVGEVSSSTCTEIPLRILDVGSCYGPYRGHFDALGSISSAASTATPFTIKSEHVDVDLCPYEGSGVHQLDWLDCKFHSSGNSSGGDASSSSSSELVRFGDDDAEANSSSTSTTKKAVSLLTNSFHVVIFCFMLSYLPTREMRLRSCFHALRSLKVEGLFCIVSTRTQGPRSGKWVEPWTACIEGLGFRIAQKVIKSKVILLTFQKVADMAPPLLAGAEADVEAYYRANFLPLLEKYPEGMSLHEQSM